MPLLLMWSSRVLVLSVCREWHRPPSLHSVRRRKAHSPRTHACKHVRTCACTIGALFGPQKKEKINPNKYTLLYPPLHVAAKYGHVQVRLACPPASLPACMRLCFALCWSVHLRACVAASTARVASAASVA
jgi:hypothetical protein